MSAVGWRGWKRWLMWATLVVMVISGYLAKDPGVSLKWRLISLLVQMFSFIFLVSPASTWNLKDVCWTYWFMWAMLVVVVFSGTIATDLGVSVKWRLISFLVQVIILIFSVSCLTRRTTEEESTYMLDPELIKRRGEVGHKITGKSDQPMKSAIQTVPMLESPLLFEISDDSSFSSGGAEEYQQVVENL